MNSTELGFITAAVRNYMLYIKISSDKDRDKKRENIFFFTILQHLVGARGTTFLRAKKTKLSKSIKLTIKCFVPQNSVKITGQKSMSSMIMSGKIYKLYNITKTITF